MSYQALARKWRPRQFEDLVGQRHVVRALTHALAQDRLHHALLFSGTRGVGKTTLARIIAKCLNCERSGSVTAQPCVDDDACSACREIDQGRFVDLIEVDAASRTGVEDMRELMDNVHYAPTRGRAKVYLIDEVHMLSKHSFNALLKTLEEPPPRVQFLFATTEPEKLPVTILSRCLHFPLKRLPVPEISKQIEYILAAEQLTAENDAIGAIARAADGSMRDGLSLLDQAIAFGGGSLTVEQVRDMLGTIGQAQVQELIEAIVAADAGGALAALEAAYAQGMDMRYLLETLATAWQEIATEQVIGARVAEDGDRWPQVSSRVTAADVQLYYDIALAGLRDLAYAPDPLIGARMTILRMLAFMPASAQQGAGQPQSAPAAPVATGRHAQPPRSPANDTTASAPATTPARQAVPEGDSALSAAATPAEIEPPPVVAAQVPIAQSGAAMATGDDWASLVQKMALYGMTAQLAANGTCQTMDDKLLTLALPRAHEHLATDSACRKLQQALDRLWQPASAPKLKVEIVAAVEDAPARRAEQAADARQQEAVRAIENDPTVRQLQERLGAHLRTDSIKPNDNPG